jgi:epoxyqueuosine reductase
MINDASPPALAADAGFDLAGIAPAGPSPRAASFRSWLAEGFHADMAWMARDPATRCDVSRLDPAARCVLVVGLSYFVERPDPAYWDDPLRGQVARYAWGADYHGVMRERLDALRRAIDGRFGPGTAGRPFVDTRPVLERAAAESAGLGFVGRHAQLIHPDWGSCIVLGGIPLMRAWAPTPPMPSDARHGCGRCRRCLDACPGGALARPHVLDSRRCVSYLTVECRGAIPPELRPALGRRIFGCDACQEACPWMRRRARPSARPFLRFEPDLAAPRLTELLEMDEAVFSRRFGATPLARAGRRGLRRNAAVALGNGGSPAARPALERAAADADELVAEHARWALARLG